ncbi:MAG: cation-translocating P-type ATPase, partial [Planctomycetes bacterium]|nr:cation-translocating P-type ATPase [Planctomycetota bacterium]
MSNLSAPASARLSRSLDVPLTLGERSRIVVQLGSAMLATALLAVGWIQRRYGPPELRNIAELIIAVAACVVLAPIFVRAVRGVLSRDAGTMTEQLVALASLAAMATGDFVTATLVPVIMNLGHFLEERSVLGAQAAIEGLRHLHARRATLLGPDGERDVDPSLLKPGDMLLIRPGDVVAADGEVVDGESAVDQSPITGESIPEDVAPSSPVYAASINLTGLLRVRVTRTGNKTALGRVVELLRGAEQSKTPVLKLIEQYANYYVPIVLTVAAVVLFISRDISRAVAVLVVG